MDLTVIAHRIVLSSCIAAYDDEFEGLCNRCFYNEPKPGYDVCPECCDHPRSAEKREGDKLICTKCGEVLATGLKDKPRIWAERESDEAQTKWEEQQDI
jgi:hypothetical protein